MSSQWMNSPEARRRHSFIPCSQEILEVFVARYGHGYSFPVILEDFVEIGLLDAFTTLNNHKILDYAFVGRKLLEFQLGKNVLFGIEVDEFFMSKTEKHFLIQICSDISTLERLFSCFRLEKYFSKLFQLRKGTNGMSIIIEAFIGWVSCSEDIMALSNNTREEFCRNIVRDVLLFTLHGFDVDVASIDWIEKKKCCAEMACRSMFPYYYQYPFYRVVQPSYRTKKEFSDPFLTSLFDSCTAVAFSVLMMDQDLKRKKYKKICNQAFMVSKKNAFYRGDEDYRKKVKLEDVHLDGLTKAESKVEILDSFEKLELWQIVLEVIKAAKKNGKVAMTVSKLIFHSAIICQFCKDDETYYVCVLNPSGHTSLRKKFIMEGKIWDCSGDPLVFIEEVVKKLQTIIPTSCDGGISTCMFKSR